MMLGISNFEVFVQARISKGIEEDENRVNPVSLQATRVKKRLDVDEEILNSHKPIFNSQLWYSLKVF